jgi:hypothetical protein
LDNIPPQARLFTLRIWSSNEDSAPEWRARFQDVQSGEVTYCADWDSLIARIEETLREQGDRTPSD